MTLHAVALLYTCWVTRLEPVSLWLTSSRSRYGPKCHPCHCPSRCVLKWNCCNKWSHSSRLVKNDLGKPYFSLLFYCILLYTGSSSDNWLAVSCIYSPRHFDVWNTGFKCKSCTQSMWLIINHFVTVTIMYYSNLQVNYMVTVFIRQLLLFSLYVCFHVLNVLFAWVFSNTDAVSLTPHPAPLHI